MVSIAQTARRILTVAVLATSILTLIPTAAGAQAGCGTHSFGFAGTRLLNDGISNSAGPFTIELPAGTYDVTLVSGDSHSAQPDPSQAEEQWFVQLDGSWASPLTPDLADELDHDSVTFASLKVPAASQISVHHRGVGGVNSIDVVCVGFTPSPEADEPIAEIAPPVDPVLPEPPDEVAAPDLIPPAAEIAPPVGPIVAPPPADAPIPEIEVAGPQADLAPPAVPVEPEVLGATETPAPQLALTGPNDLIWALTIGGFAMILLGAGLVAREQRIRA